MIVNNISQFDHAIPTAAGSDFENLETYIRSSERWIRDKILGQILYTAVLSTEDAELKDLCVNVICLDAYASAIPFLDVIQTTNGFAVVSNSNHAPASKERVERLIRATKARKDAELENLIDYLEGAKQYHDDWKGSPAYSIISEGLIQTASELKRLCKWDGSRTEFLQMKPVLLLKIRTELYTVFGKDLIDEIIEQQRDEDISPANSMIIDSIKFCLANFATGNNKQAVVLRNEIINVLDADISNYPKYAASAEYKARHAEKFENTKDSGTFMFMGGMG